MRFWSLTPNREAVSTLVDLWERPEWRSSAHAAAIHVVLSGMLDGPDEVNRLHATHVARLLAEDDDSALELLRARLLTEQEPHIAAALLDQLYTFRDSHPMVVDGTITPVAQTQLWKGILASSEREPALTEILGTFIRLVLYLALRHQAPQATALARQWFTSPASSEAARQAVGGTRDWIALPPERAGERKLAFALVRLSVAQLVQIRDTAHDHDTRGAALRTADTIAHNLYFASGAHATNDDAPKTPDRGFAEEAFETLRLLSAFKSPSTVHPIVQTLNHLASFDPRRAFLLVNETITTGDAYTYDSLAAEETTSLIERYFAEFRDHVITDSELLTAIRDVLHAFVEAGWPSAITLTYDMSDAFR